jgi:hypothetical protein
MILPCSDAMHQVAIVMRWTPVIADPSHAHPRRLALMLQHSHAAAGATSVRTYMRPREHFRAHGRSYIAPMITQVVSLATFQQWGEATPNAPAKFFNQLQADRSSGPLELDALCRVSAAQTPSGSPQWIWSSSAPSQAGGRQDGRVAVRIFDRVAWFRRPAQARSYGLAPAQALRRRGSQLCRLCACRVGRSRQHPRRQRPSGREHKSMTPLRDSGGAILAISKGTHRAAGTPTSIQPARG